MTAQIKSIYHEVCHTPIKNPVHLIGTGFSFFGALFFNAYAWASYGKSNPKAEKTRRKPLCGLCSDGFRGVPKVLSRNCWAGGKHGRCSARPNTRHSPKENQAKSQRYNRPSRGAAQKTTGRQA